LIACSNNIERKIGSKGKNCGTVSNCTVIISQLTDFAWDKMFVFDATESLQDINKIMGIDYSQYFEDYTRSIIFTKNNQIVHNENNKWDPEDAVDGEVIFDYPDSVKYTIYTPTSAQFTLKMKHSGTKTYYILSHKLK